MSETLDFTKDADYTLTIVGFGCSLIEDSQLMGGENEIRIC
jgi:hypothetical protein